MNRGTFFTFEGIDGCGKTTQLAMAARALRARGYDVLETREPTSGRWGRRIRDMARSEEPVEAATELEWFIQDRVEHVRGEIQPAVSAGRVVLCDRYILSTVAYQGARAQGAGSEREANWRDLLDDQLARFPAPDRAFVFVMPPVHSLARVAERGGPGEPAFEELGFLERVAAIYEELLGSGLPWVERIAAEGSREQVGRAVQTALDAALSQRAAR